jgi:hypothetical protein
MNRIALILVVVIAVPAMPCCSKAIDEKAVLAKLKDIKSKATEHCASSEKAIYIGCAEPVVNKKDNKIVYVGYRIPTFEIKERVLVCFTIDHFNKYDVNELAKQLIRDYDTELRRVYGKSK